MNLFHFPVFFFFFFDREELACLTCEIQVSQIFRNFMSCFDITFGSLKLVGLFNHGNWQILPIRKYLFVPREPVVKNLAAYHCHLTKASPVHQLYLGGFSNSLPRRWHCFLCGFITPSVWPHLLIPLGLCFPGILLNPPAPECLPGKKELMASRQLSWFY